MEFGLFVQAHVPSHEVEADPEGAEHSRLMRELELAEACDRSGWKYVWSVEHHFLEEYSHISASEIFLPYVAARTKRIHVGSAIYNITPPVNHPARIAERVAMLDHLSEGRFEFGTGRGSSSTEFKGFGIPDGDTTRAMYDEALPQILRMWKEDALLLRRAASSRCPSATCCRSRTRSRTRRSGWHAAARRRSRRPAASGWARSASASARRRTSRR